jgi:hypothetical protein
MAPIVYHTGSLAIDRQRDKAVGDRARSLLRQAEAGEVELTQRRAGPGRFGSLARYRAIEPRRVAV